MSFYLRVAFSRSRLLYTFEWDHKYFSLINSNLASKWSYKWWFSKNRNFCDFFASESTFRVVCYTLLSRTLNLRSDKSEYGLKMKLRVVVFKDFQTLWLFTSKSNFLTSVFNKTIFYIDFGLINSNGIFSWISVRWNRNLIL